MVFSSSLQMADSLVQGFHREKRRKEFLVSCRYKKTRYAGLMMVPGTLSNCLINSLIFNVVIIHFFYLYPQKYPHNERAGVIRYDIIICLISVNPCIHQDIINF